MTKKSYELKHPRQDKKHLLRLDGTAIDLIKKAAALLRLKPSNFIRLSISQALAELPLLACASAAEQAQELFDEKMFREFGKSRNEIDYSDTKVVRAIRGLELQGGEIPDSNVFIPIEPRRRNFRSFGLQLSEAELNIFAAALDPKAPAVDRQLAKAELSKLIKNRTKLEFDAVKRRMLQLPELWSRACKTFRPSDIARFKNDPEMLEFLLEARSRRQLAGTTARPIRKRKTPRKKSVRRGR